MTALRAQRYEMDNGRCVDCGISVSDDFPDWHPRKFHLAHVIPKARGGDTIPNTRTKCGHCHGVLEHCYGPSRTKPCPAKPKAA